MKSAIKYLLFFSLVITSSLSLSLEEGSKSEVSAIFVGTDSDSYPYITLKQSNSMVGCHGDSGGYLVGTDISKAYATALAALRAGSEIKAYFQINEGASGWSKCHIKSLYAY